MVRVLADRLRGSRSSTYPTADVERLRSHFRDCKPTAIALARFLNANVTGDENFSLRVMWAIGRDPCMTRVRAARRSSTFFIVQHRCRDNAHDRCEHRDARRDEQRISRSEHRHQSDECERRRSDDDERPPLPSTP